MKKTVCFAWALFVMTVFVGCGSAQDGSALRKLNMITDTFSLSGMGAVYARGEKCERELSDELVARMFSEGGNITAFENVKSCAVFLFQNFSDGEIDVIELCDVSHKPEMLAVVNRRARKKSGAVVLSRGRYIFLISCDDAEKIADYIRKL